MACFGIFFSKNDDTTAIQSHMQGCKICMYDDMHGCFLVCQGMFCFFFKCPCVCGYILMEKGEKLGFLVEVAVKEVVFVGWMDGWRGWRGEIKRKGYNNTPR